MKIFRVPAIVILMAIFLWLLLEIGLRLYVELPLQADFYGSIPRDRVHSQQLQHGIKTVIGNNWIHIGWIADPDNETYIVEYKSDTSWNAIGETRYGSFLIYDLSGSFRVTAISKNGQLSHVLGPVSASIDKTTAPVYKPSIDGSWTLLFKPALHGNYINDHTVFRDAQGEWRILGITSKSDGNYNEEKYFASGYSDSFPPADGMYEAEPVADFGDLAWAPHVINEKGIYHMFWSPHRLEYMSSKDGVTWDFRRTLIQAPCNKFFRDAMIYKVTEGQWLLYTTARSAFFSQVDIYQSFDLEGWQYIRTALQSSWGSERNSPFASTESPFVIEYKDRYYLSVTYNNDTFFWNGILLPLKVWIDRASYNETLVFQSDNPYDFGVYRGKNNTQSLVTVLQTHAPEYIHVDEDDKWFITTAGWPWITSLTSGEVAYAPLKWEPITK